MSSYTGSTVIIAEYFEHSVKLNSFPNTPWYPNTLKTSLLGL